jgi:hypothetical protein
VLIVTGISRLMCYPTNYLEKRVSCFCLIRWKRTAENHSKCGLSGS